MSMANFLNDKALSILAQKWYIDITRGCEKNDKCKWNK